MSSDKIDPRHLVAVWNPSYAAHAIEETLSLLLEFVHKATDEDDEVYVWWGKIKSQNRQAPLPHLGDILAIDLDLKGESGPEREVHLYLTDYRSLYVAHLAEVTAEDVREDERDHVPRFYMDERLTCDCWFRLWDIRRVIADDTPAVVDELAKLRNVRYHGRPVSIYGGMVDLPLIVTRDDDARYFEADVRERLTGGRFWAEFDAERVGIGQMERELRDNLFGNAVWSALDPAARGFIATAESVIRSHRDDPSFDFGPAIVDFAKAFEVQVNLVLRRALRGAPEAARRANLDGRTLDVTSGEQWSLGQLSHVIGEEQQVNQALKRRLASGGEWFTSSLPPILRDLAETRNPAAHSERVMRDDALKIRNRLVGVGCMGAINELGRVR
jgi:hypothetical protein